MISDSEDDLQQLVHKFRMIRNRKIKNIKESIEDTTDPEEK